MSTLDEITNHPRIREYIDQEISEWKCWARLEFGQEVEFDTGEVLFDHRAGDLIVLWRQDATREAQPFMQIAFTKLSLGFHDLTPPGAEQ